MATLLLLWSLAVMVLLVKAVAVIEVLVVWWSGWY